MPTMPNLIGQPLSEAQASLENAGVLVPSSLGYFGTWPISVSCVPASSVSTEFTADSEITADSSITVDTVALDNLNPGVIVSQSPGAGSSVAVNPSILLTLIAYPMGFAYPAQNWSAF